MTALSHKSEASRLLMLARAEVGYHEGRSGGHWDNREKYAATVPSLAWANGQPWCHVFVCAMAQAAGILDLFPVTASCDVGRGWWKSHKRWSEYPAIGAQVYYGTPSDANHTGLVLSFDADTITTIEGNTNDNGSREGDGVYLKHRQRRSANVLGYGYPAYVGGIESADPSWPTPTIVAGGLPNGSRLTRGRHVDDALASIDRALAAAHTAGRRAKLAAARDTLLTLGRHASS